MPQFVETINRLSKSYVSKLAENAAGQMQSPKRQRIDLLKPLKLNGTEKGSECEDGSSSDGND